MSYQFAGFFAAPDVPEPKSLPPGGVWREIAKPFVGVGLRIPEFVGKSPEPGLVVSLAQELGIASSSNWLYVTYDCWAGEIDFIYGIGSRDAITFGPIETSDSSQIKSFYTSLMQHFGVNEADAFQFAPFERGFWGEA